MSIAWEPLINVEAKLVSAGMVSNSYKFFSRRIDQLYSETEDTDSDSVSSARDSCDSAVSVADLHALIKSTKNAPFHDIPRLDDKYNDDNLPDNELELWAALISDFRQVATKLPVYTSMMVLNGIPPSLRGLAWKSMSESQNSTIESLYDMLAEEWTPFVKIIARDLNRTFPELTLFQKKGGEGQAMLGRVLRAYSAYDIQVGYCQGLTFLAGPLLLHMDDKSAFCTLVKLMEDYDLRSMFTADMAGLPLRIYQFENLFKEHLPDLHAHFKSLGIGSVYATQWFLSFYAVTCPLDMLMRIYDLMFAEGAIPTMMRVALAVLKRNQTIFLHFDEEEQVLERLLGRSLWDVYGFDGDQLCNDIGDFPSSIMARIDQLHSQYVSEGRQKQLQQQAQELKASGPATQKVRPRLNTHRLASWLSVSTNNSCPQTSPTGASSRGECDSSIALSSDDGDVRRSTLSASSASSIASSTATKRTAEDIQHELDKSRIALDLERHERESDRDAIEELLSLIEKPGVISDSNENIDKIDKVTAQLRQRLNLTASNKPVREGAVTCGSCDRLMMDLASIKAREVMARQEIDMLTDKVAELEAQQEDERKHWQDMIQIQSQSQQPPQPPQPQQQQQQQQSHHAHKPSVHTIKQKSPEPMRPPSPPSVQRRESLLRPLPQQSNRWSILGRS